MLFDFKILFALVGIAMSSSTTFGQIKDNILLPSKTSNAHLIETDSTKFTNIYVTKDHNVYIEQKRILWWDEIISTVLKDIRDEGVEQLFYPPILFHCDKDALYAFVDRVKEEVARCSQIKVFVYKVGTLKDGYGLVGLVQGTTKETITSEPIGTRDKLIQSINLRLPSWLTSLEPTANDSLRKEFRNFLCAGKIKETKSFLFRYKYKHILLLPDKKFKYGNKLPPIGDLKIVQDWVDHEHILFVRFDDKITYGDYIAYLDKIRKISNNAEKHYPNEGIIVEVSFGLEKKFQEWNLGLFDENTKF